MNGFDAKKVVSFSGQVGRAYYWGQLVTTIILLKGFSVLIENDPGDVLNGLFLAIFVVMVVVLLSTYVRRWHDRGKSGWWHLIGLVPFVGAIWIVIELGFLPGSSGINRFGPPSSGSPFGE